MDKKIPKAKLAKSLGISLSTLYYKSKQEEKDWKTKCLIEGGLREHPSYGHKRLAPLLHMNRKRVRRVMKKYGIKPYRRRGKKWLKPKKKVERFPNLLLHNFPSRPNQIWVSDFTYIQYKKTTVYLCTVEDIFLKRVVGFSVLLRHSNELVVNTLISALNGNPKPEIFHSDNGSEFDSKDFKEILTNLNIKMSRSKPGCPWENGYQESFYDKFKVDLGDPNRFSSLGELIFNIYQTIYYYNNFRIHTKLKMAPNAFARQYAILNSEYKHS
jgi:transposase InsO family protein